MQHHLLRFSLLLLLISSCQPSAEELFDAGVAALEKQEYNQAIEYFDRVIETEANFPSAYNARGVAFFELAQWDKAIDSFSESIELDSSNYKPYFNRGNAFMEKEAYKEALYDYNRANGLDFNQPDIYYNRGLALLGLEMYDDALVDFDMALQANPEDTRVLFNKAKAQLGNNDPLNAITSLNEVVRLDKRNAAAYYLLGVTEMSALGNKEAGCTQLKMALSLGYTQAKEWIDDFCQE
ncbi:Tetratricopeptide repeat-containing protein [Cyclobacterium lianum]|uniref:Tetratricopeptide repeat-containing protein n=1 Tax=Cyclobacterium lianum TaxID=388280 RepID=A0A1M7NBY0_9BACT|nr:tetratricopeptide repeat protein [Cyclobacterium lianum]SHN01197.1 Tetratricopeptide repeat-containing protein [Cyclobacterium lianum]